jgi:hypothetical protein
MTDKDFRRYTTADDESPDVPITGKREKQRIYRIIERIYADGRTEYTVRFGWFSWIRGWYENMVGDGGWWEIERFNTYDNAYAAVCQHAQEWRQRHKRTITKITYCIARLSNMCDTSQEAQK